MSFSKAAVHGIYMLCYLSRQDSGSVISASTLAKAVDVPPEQARKVLMRLCAAGLVASVNGRSGGYAAARSMQDTSVLDVLDALGPVADDHSLQPRACVAAPDETCCMQRGLAELRERMRILLASKTLNSIIGGACARKTRTFGASNVASFPKAIPQ